MSKKCLKCGKINDDLVSTCVECKFNEFQPLEQNTKNKKQNNKNISKIIFISVFVIVFAMLINSIIQYGKLKIAYDSLENQKNSLERSYDELNDMYNKLKQKNEKQLKKLKNSKLMFDFQETQEKLKSFGLHIENDISTYWEYKDVFKFLEGTYWEIYPCISFTLVNNSKKRLDSAIITASFSSDLGTASVIVDNLHPNRGVKVHLRSSLFMKTSNLNEKNIPNVEADVKITINDREEFSTGFLQVNKIYQKIK